MTQDWPRASGPGGGSPLASLLLGQVISVLITGTGAFASLLAEHGVDIPAVQASLNYILLCVHLLWSWPWGRASDGSAKGPTAPAWRYALWALADVEANYLVVWAYQYTSVASVMLLDCFAIPCAMLVSRIALGARYSPIHIAACLICVVGLALTVLSDVMTGKVGPSPHGPAWLGDLMVLTGAALYGVSNVQQELVLKSGGSARRSEALGMLGLWGSLISCVQAVAVERTSFEQCVWTPWVVLLLVGYQLCLFGMYVLTSRFLLRSDATLFNLSMLTSDVYSVVFAWQVQHQRFSWLYGAAFVTTMAGVVVYNTQPPPVAAELENLKSALLAAKANGAPKTSPT